MVQPTIEPKCEKKYWQAVHQACEETLPQENKYHEFQPKHFQGKLLLPHQCPKHHQTT